MTASFGSDHGEVLPQDRREKRSIRAHSSADLHASISDSFGIFLGDGARDIWDIEPERYGDR